MNLHIVTTIVMMAIILTLVLGFPAGNIRAKKSAPSGHRLLAKKHHLTDSEQEAGIASDANGIPCTFGPNHDGCKDKIADDGTDVSNYSKLPSNQHYGVCEEVGPNNELACDVVNNTSTTGGLYDLKLSDNPRADFQSGLQHGKADVKASCNHPEGCHWWIRMRGNGSW